LPGKTRLRNDLLCVEWDVKPYSLTRLVTSLITALYCSRVIFILRSTLQSCYRRWLSAYHSVPTDLSCLLTAGRIQVLDNGLALLQRGWSWWTWWDMNQQRINSGTEWKTRCCSLVVYVGILRDPWVMSASGGRRRLRVILLRLSATEYNKTHAQ